MASKAKPVLVQKLIAYENPDKVTREVEELVSNLYNDGYKKIKVIIHGNTVETGTNGTTYTWYSTTVVATYIHFIDIDQK